MREGEPGSGGQREGGQKRRRKDGWGTKGGRGRDKDRRWGRERGSRHLELRQVAGCLSSSESSPYHPVGAGPIKSERFQDGGGKGTGGLSHPVILLPYPLGPSQRRLPLPTGQGPSHCLGENS